MHAHLIFSFQIDIIWMLSNSRCDIIRILLRLKANISIFSTKMILNIAQAINIKDDNIFIQKRTFCRYIQARLKPSTLRHSLYNALIKPLKWISNYLQFLNEWIKTFTKFLLFFLYQPMLSMSTISDHFAIKCSTNKLLFFFSAMKK